MPESPLRILVIEDDAASRAALTQCLREEHCVVIGAADGATGLDIALREPLDLVTHWDRW